MNPEGGGCGEPGSRHCTPAWVTTAKLCLKKKKKKAIKDLLGTIGDIRGFYGIVNFYRFNNKLSLRRSCIITGEI